MKSFFIIVTLIFIFLNIAEAQIPKEPGNIPSPQAWNFVQYGKTPISYFTGLPNISVNLDQVEQSGFKIPITLNYNVASVKTDLHPGTTGLGWNLNLGGVVTRNVRGLTDEFYFQQTINFNQQGNETYTYFNGYRNNSNSVLTELSPQAILASSSPVLCQGNILLCGVNNTSSANLRTIPQILPYLWDNVTYMQPNCPEESCWFYLLKGYPN